MHRCMERKRGAGRGLPIVSPTASAYHSIKRTSLALPAPSTTTITITKGAGGEASAYD